MAEVRFEGVTKSFGAVRVLEPLDVAVRDGEFFTVVGPSGCGKSTILNLVAGLEAPTSGTIYFDDQPVNHLSPRDRDVAMVFQSYALYPHLSVFDNIAFPLKMRRVPKPAVRTQVERTAELLDIRELLPRRPRELSGGQRQRVALGRAIIRRPRVFLMDEPLSNLDAKLRVDTRAELKRLHQQLGITTIYVTHDQEEALGLSERLAVLSGGCIQQCGPPDEVYARPANLFVAGFLGSPTMNFIPARVEQKAPPVIMLNGVTIRPAGVKAPSTGEAVVGIRPEDLVLSSKQGTCEGKVTTVEFVGSGHWVEFTWAEHRLKGFLSTDNHLESSSTVYFDFPAEKCFVFDASSGERL